MLVFVPGVLVVVHVVLLLKLVLHVRVRVAGLVQDVLLLWTFLVGHERGLVTGFVATVVLVWVFWLCWDLDRWELF